MSSADGNSHSVREIRVNDLQEQFYELQRLVQNPPTADGQSQHWLSPTWSQTAVIGAALKDWNLSICCLNAASTNKYHQPAQLWLQTRLLILDTPFKLGQHFRLIY